MRWFPDMDVLGAWRGDALLYAADGTNISVQLRLDRPDANWRICIIENEVPLTSSCTPAFFGVAAARPDEPWTEIYAGAETLRILGRDGGARATVFNGARDGCD